MYFASLYFVYATTGGGATGFLAASVYMAAAYSCVARGGCLVGRWGGGAEGPGKYMFFSFMRWRGTRD